MFYFVKVHFSIIAVNTIEKNTIVIIVPINEKIVL